MRLVNSPDSLKKYTHLIMDEVHERDLDIDFSMVVVKHLLAKSEEEGLKFKLLLMSATFNTELFANYFSPKSIAGVELIESYKGCEEMYKQKEAERKANLAKDWGPNGGKHKLDKNKNDSDDDQWVETKPSDLNVLPVKKVEDPVDIVEINARMFAVQEFYLDKMILNFK
jgi:hypothetical protein